MNKPMPVSPSITAAELSGKTWTEIRQLAQAKGLGPAGNSANPDYPRRWKDPVTGHDRIRLDRGHVDPKTGQSYNNPNAAVDHVHGYELDGVTSVSLNGDPHIPTVGP